MYFASRMGDSKVAASQSAKFGRVCKSTYLPMSGDQLERMFEPFTQADESSTRKFDGSGLGMTITRKFCEALGGEVHVESHPDQGTTVILRVPSLIRAGREE